MTSTIEQLARRVYRDGLLLPMGDGVTGIFDPALAMKVDNANAQNLQVRSVLAGLTDAHAAAPAIPWRSLRALLTERNRQLNTPLHLRALHARMEDRLAGAGDGEQDLTWLIARLASRALLPMVVAGLDASGEARIGASLDAQFYRLAAPVDEALSLGVHLAAIWHQLVAGRAVARHVKRRLAGRLPPADDFAAITLAFAGELGVRRINYLVMTLVIAISGAPGSVGGCLALEIVRHPEWAARIGAEFEALNADELYDLPVRKLPVTMRFLKEVMRLWAFPLVSRRPVERDLEVGDIALSQGQFFELSSYVQHHSPASWENPEAFDPDRWLPDRPRPPMGAYVPFGFGQRACVGASVGQSMLLLLCELLTRRFEIVPTADARPHIHLDGVALPRDFRGSVRRREG